MENRFGFKDLVSAALTVTLIVVVVLGMKQLDRQWKKLLEIENQNDLQAKTVASLKRTLNDLANNGISLNASGTGNGSVGAATTGPTTGPAGRVVTGDPFKALRAAETRPDFAAGDWLIDNVKTKLPKLTPLIATDLYSDWVQAKVLETLAYRDPDTLDYVPLLARSFQISPDGMRFTFQLRRGVTFSDGEPLTADDVVFSFKLIMNPKINAPRFRAYYSKIKSVEQTGPDEVTFTMAEPYYDSLDLCATMDILPKHFYSKFNEEEINQNPGLLMGTGPYKLRDPTGWRPGQKAELVRNESYWGQPGPFSRMIFLEVEEEAAAETMLGNGELDVYRALPEQFNRALANPQIAGRVNKFVIDSTINGYYFIAWNQSRGGQTTRFADRRVRKAMGLLVDRERICNDVFLGYASPISGPFAAGSPQADPSIKPLPYDVAEGKRLLAEAGFADRNGDGVLEGPDGTPFRFKLTYGSGNSTVDRYMLFIKDNYARVGITCDLDPIDWPILLKKLEQRDFDAIHMGFGGSVESDLFQEYDSSQIADAGDNFMSYRNEALDKLMREARRTVDAPKRMELWHQCHRILAEDQPHTFLFSRKVLRLIDKRVQNVQASKVELNLVDRWRMPIPWYVPKAMQKYKE